MLRKVLAVLAFAAVTLMADPVKVWNADNGFEGMKAGKNAEAVVADGLLKVNLVARDPQLVFDNVKLDAMKCNVFTYKYRASGVGHEEGQLYYAHDGEGFSQQRFWKIPAMKNDGEWHTVTLTGRHLVDASTWFTEAPVTKLRFDPTDTAGGSVEFAEIAFQFDPKAVTKSMLLPPLPAVKPKLDAPVWPERKPFFNEPPAASTQVPKAYFHGKMLVSPEDKLGLGEYTTFYMRRVIKLKAAPIEAWLQFTGDDYAQAYINGTHVATMNNWRLLQITDVKKHLRAGDNAWGLRYTNTGDVGGVIGELFVRYADGTCEHFNSDGSFSTSVKEQDGWATAGFDAKGWGKPILKDGAPTPPWRTVWPYRDFENAQAVVKSSLVPSDLQAGETMHVQLTFKGKMPSLPFKASANLRREGKILWDEAVEFNEGNTKPNGDGTWSIDLRYATPMYISTTECDFTLESPHLTMSDGTYPTFPVKISQLKSIPGYEQPPVFKVGNVAGTPVFTRNGKPEYFVWCGVQRERRVDKLPIHSAYPVNLVTVYLNDSNVWTKLDEINFSEYDRQAEAYRRNNPNAYFVFNIMCYPPMEWAKKYPDEMCLDSKGDVNRDGRCNYSFASKQALKDLDEFVTKAITYLEHSPYANRIAGYRICGGHTLEWLGWDPKPGLTVDFSPAAQKAFTEYMHTHYPEIQDTSIPTLEERSELDDEEILWEPKKHRRAIAYTDFYSEAIVDMMVALCRRAKSIAGENKLVGTYYGYTMTLASYGAAHMRAHYLLRKVLDAKCMDFLISPHPYRLRNIGDIMGDMKPFATMAMNGIVPVIEEDSRTFNGPSGMGYYQTINEETTLDVVRRNIGFIMCRNNQPYFYALSQGTEFDFPQMAKDFAVVQEAGQHCLEKGVSRNAKVALVVSEEAIKSMPMLNRWVASGELSQTYEMNGKVTTKPRFNSVFTGESFDENYIRFARCGAAVDYVLAEDLAKHAGDYQLYVFANCFNYDQALLEAVEKLRQRDCTLLWVYAPGFAFNDACGVESMKKLTGFTFAKADKPIVPEVTLTDGRAMGNRTHRVAPMFHVIDKDVEVLGRYKDGKVGLASKKTGQATSIFCGVWQFDVPFIRETASKAGAHITATPSDPMEANDSLIMIHARFPGQKTVKLPRKCNVIDLFEKKLVAKGTDTFTFTANLHDTHLFYYGDDAEELLKKLEK